MDGFYSAIVFDAKNHAGRFEWRLFEYARSQRVEGTADLIATSVHTNVPRSGLTGLPREWEMDVYQWRAVASHRFSEAVMQWAAQCSATFHYNAKIVQTLPLVELLMAPQVFPGRAERDVWNSNHRYLGSVLPRIHENLSFGVTLETPTPAMTTLEAWLVEHAVEPRLTLWVYIEGHVTRGSM